MYRLPKPLARLDKSPLVSIIRNHHPKYIVVGADVDAYLSASYLVTYHGFQVVGAYDLKQIWLADGCSSDQIRNALWIDLDVYHPSITSIGHHLLRQKLRDELPGLNPNSYNPNSVQHLVLRDIGAKYPLGTIHLLLWAFDAAPLPSALPLIWHADSAWIIAKTYTENVAHWLDAMGQPPWLAKLLEPIHSNFYQAMTSLHRDLSGEGINDRGQIGFAGLRGRQMSGIAPADERVQAFLSLVTARTGWKMPWPNLRVWKTGTRRPAPVSEVSDLRSFLDHQEVFSYAFLNSRSVNYTTFPQPFGL